MLEHIFQSILCFFWVIKKCMTFTLLHVKDKYWTFDSNKFLLRFCFILFFFTPLWGQQINCVSFSKTRYIMHCVHHRGKPITVNYVLLHLSSEFSQQQLHLNLSVYWRPIEDQTENSSPEHSWSYLKSMLEIFFFF